MDKSKNKVLLPILESLNSIVSNYWQSFVNRYPEISQHFLEDTIWYQQLLRAFGCSHYFAQNCLIDGNWLFECWQQKKFIAPDDTVTLTKAIEESIDNENNKNDLMQALRIFRRRVFSKLIWRRSNKLSTLNEEWEVLSSVADLSVQIAYKKLWQWHTTEYGVPRSMNKRPLSLITIAVGKLGGQELNLSSDIDLIFTFLEEGFLADKQISYSEFFLRLTRELISILQTVNTDGYVFRVDTRLRPYGDSGALVLSLQALENYYQKQGREWERYALLKARFITGSHAEKAAVKRLLDPFVYRKYIDFTVLEALRDMKFLLQQEVKLKKLEDNIKIGAGGIREIEFIVQCLQMINGGRNPHCKGQNLLKAIIALKELNLLTNSDYKILRNSYIFFRKLEHSIQAVFDEQTHLLPKDKIYQQRATLAMGYDSWEYLHSVTTRHRKKVRSLFQKAITLPEKNTLPRSELSIKLETLWQQKLSVEDGVLLCASLGFNNPENIRKLIDTFATSHKRAQKSAKAVARLDKLMPILLEQLKGIDNIDATFVRLYDILNAVALRSAYILLLLENPKALNHLITLCTASPWFSEQIVKNPALLDEFLDVRNLYAPYSHNDLKAEVIRNLASIESDDLESQMDILRTIKQAQVLRIAANDVTGSLPVMKVSDQLTDVAEVLLTQTVNLALKAILKQSSRWEQLLKKKAYFPFAICAYGKLAGYELGYSSDLDIIFLYDNYLAENEEENSLLLEIGLRLAKRIVHILATRTSCGVLYNVDTRLRPSGDAGLLVSSLDNFANYQKNNAWLWEHQALVRSRLVFANIEFRYKFSEIRCEILTTKRDELELKNSVRNMREKIYQNSIHIKDTFDLKNDFGGITDIEFIVQYAVLRWAVVYYDLLAWPDNIRILESLQQAELLPKDMALSLIEIYQKYRVRAHHLALQNQEARVCGTEFVKERKKVIAIWEAIFS